MRLKSCLEIRRSLARLSACLVAAALAAATAFAAAPVTDAQIEAIRRDIFKETSHGNPGVTLDDIDTDFAVRVYRMPGALGAMDRILAGSDYAGINYKLGRLRNKAVWETWAKIVAEEGIRIELNNAGKQNGARSDQDLFLYTDAKQLCSERGSRIPPDGIHAYLIERFQEEWGRGMGGTDPANFDVMIFPGDGLMMDWRMSTTSWRSFAAQLNEDIARLTDTDGAYFIPAAYKNQVYTRYLAEGRTTIVKSVADAGEPPDDMDIPPGVRIEDGLTTREASLRYRNVPGAIDRNAALGVVLQNVIQARGPAIGTLKQSKYSNRWITGLTHTTNLEVDYMKLVLEGRDGARRLFAQRLFDECEAQGRTPPNIRSASDLQRVLDMMHQVEIDKIIGDAEPGSRPKNWSNKWQHHPKQNINDPKTKLQYFAEEAAEMKQSLRAASAAGLDLDEARLAQHAEMMFMDKARQVSRLAAASAARRTFQDLFTREGAMRQSYLYGKDAAARQVAERMKGLHAALVFLEDEAMIRAIIQEAPLEAARPLEMLQKIARAQRDEILKRRSTVDKLSREQLQESDEILRKLLRNIGLDYDDTVHRPPPTGVSDDYIHRRVMLRMAEAVSEVTAHNKQRVYTYLTQELPHVTTVRGFSSQYWANLTDIGTVNSMGKIAEAYLTGDPKRAQQEIWYTLIENAPLGGKWFTLAKGLKAYEKGQTSPTAMFLVNQALGAVPGGAKYGVMMGWVMAVYGLEQSLYRIGWHFIGKPAQSDAVSLILMGRMNALPHARGESAMPMIKNDQDWELVKANAILVKKVPIPQNLVKSRELREAVLRAHFLPHATRATAAQGGGVEARDEILRRDYYAHWQYWLRRLYFYEAIRKDVWRSVTPDRIKLDETVPPFIHAGNRDEYRKATMSGGKGRILWDHEEAWLRYHFRNYTLQEWIDSQREFGEVMTWLRDSTLQRTFFTGNWEEMVVDELVRYYREGEYLELARDAQRAELAEQRRAARDSKTQQKLQVAQKYVDRAEEGLHEIADKVLREEAKKNRNRQKVYETAYWHPQVVEKIRAGMEAAVRAAGEYTPGEDERPKLEVHIPRPVARSFGKVPMEITVRGDVKTIPKPQDLDIKLEYTAAGEIEGRLPPEILKDDILTLYGREIEPEKLKFIKHTVTITVTSEALPDFSVQPEARTVYWATWADEDEDDDADGDADGIDLSEAERILEQLRASADSADTKEKETKRDCDSAKGKNKTADKSTAAFEKELKGLAEQLTKLLADIEAGQKKIAEAKKKKDEAYQHALKLAALRSLIGKLSLQICETTEAIKDSIKADKPEAERRALYADAEAKIGVLKQKYAEAKMIYSTIKRLEKEVAAVADELHKLDERIQKAQETFAEFDQPLKQIKQFMTSYRKTVADAKDKAAAVQKLKKNGSGLLQRGENIVKPLAEESEKARDLARQMREQFGRISRSEQNAKDCPEDVAQTLKEMEKKVTAAEKRTAAFRKTYDDYKKKVASVSFSGDIDDVLADIKSTRIVADALWESIEDYRVGAALCLAIAQDLISGRLKVKVPAVTGQTVAAARNALAGVNLKAAIVGGDKAPSQDLAFKVAEQKPGAGADADPDTSVVLKVYSGYEPSVPAVKGLTVPQARAAITAAGLQCSVRAGENAPKESLAFRVAAQEPAPLTKVEPKTVVRITVYNDYLVSVPSVLKMDSARAANVLRAAGLTAAIRQAPVAGATARPGSVVSQSPEPLKKVKPGTTVRLAVAQRATATPPPEPEPDPPPPPVQPTPSTGERFYVALTGYDIDLQALKPPEGTKYKDLLARLSVDQVKLKAGDAPAILVVSGRGLGRYNAAQFTPGKRFSGNTSLFMTLPKEEQQERAPEEKAKIKLPPRAEKALTMSGAAGLLEGLAETFSKITEEVGEEFDEGERVVDETMNLKNVKILENSRLQIKLRVDGAALFETVAVFDSFDSLCRQYPKAASPRGMTELLARHKDGRFEVIMAKTGDDEDPFETVFRYSGGPLIEGWPKVMRQKQLDFYRALATIFNCFVTSVVYDFNIFAPQLNTFRRFRDMYLEQTADGQALVNWYYRRGPALAEWVARHPGARGTLRPVFDGMSAYLAARPYERSEAHRIALDVLIRVGRTLVEITDEETEVKADPCER